MSLRITGVSNYRDVAGSIDVRQEYVSSLINIVPEIRVTSSDADEPELITVSATFRRPRSDGSTVHTTGHGAGRDAASAMIPAIAEAIERHAATVFYEEQFVWSSAEHLKERALDLDSIPTCSHEEMKKPNCPLGLPRKDKPIRWVKGLSLHDGEPIWLPAVMVYLNIGWREEQERFWLPISTGCAAGTSYEGALLNALCEVVERDSVVITWLQQLQWPRITIDHPGPITRPLWRLCQERTGDIEYHFFDSTTDVGLPTIYGVQISRHHPRAHTVVASSTALSYDEALAKTVKDLIVFKRAFIRERSIGSDPSSFVGLMDGATYMGRPERVHAFEFLLGSPREVPISTLLQSHRSPTDLSGLLRMLRKLKMQVVAVDLTTKEAQRAGLYVVRVLVPELQPLSFNASALYLGNRRLYSAPSLLGFEVKTEAELNRWPQPFA